jgi:hypothetical protein
MVDKATAPQKSSRSRYAIDPEAIAAGRLPEKAPLVTSAANPHYQKHFELGARLARCFILDVSTRAPAQKPPIPRSGGSLACPAITPPASSASTGFVQRPTPSCSPQAARSEPQNASGSSSHTGSAGRSASAQPDPPAMQLPLPRARIMRPRVNGEFAPSFQTSALPYLSYLYLYRDCRNMLAGRVGGSRAISPRFPKTGRQVGQVGQRADIITEIIRPDRTLCLTSSRTRPAKKQTASLDPERYPM